MLFKKNELGTSHGSYHQHKAKRLAVLMSVGAEPPFNSGRILVLIQEAFSVQYELKIGTYIKVPRLFLHRQLSAARRYYVFCLRE